MSLDDLGFLWKFRLSPPPLPAGDDLQWVFRRALGPVEGPTRGPVDANAALRLATELGLAGRVCSRVPIGRLEAELGPLAARKLVLHHLQVRAANRVLSEALDVTVARAEELEVDVAPLKHAALWLAGRLVEGERDARDVDVLAKPHHASALWHRLREDGFLPVGGATTGPHLPPLLSRSGACIELHDRVWGVTAGGRGVTPADLETNGLAARSTTRRHLLLPTRSFLIAHSLVHGLAQHLTSPASYAPARVLADLVDLEASLDDLDSVESLLDGHLDPTSIRAAIELAGHLASGGCSEGLPPASATLLAHLLGASMDPLYRRALRARRLWELVRQRELLNAAKRFLSPPSGSYAEGARSNRSALGTQAREAWDLLLGVLSHTQLRRGPARARTSSTTSGSRSSVDLRNS